MVVWLVLLTFFGFAIVGALLARRAPAPERAAVLRAGEPVTVEGFALFPGLRYHPGHTWAAEVGRGRIRVGLNDLVRRLVGTPDRISLPAAGREVHAGEPVLALSRGGREIALAVPVTGEIAAVNQAVIDDPALASTDPIGEGWLVEVRPARADAPSGLLTGIDASAWLAGVVDRLRILLPGQAGFAMADGGEAVPDYFEALDRESWERLVARLLDDAGHASGRDER